MSIRRAAVLSCLLLVACGGGSTPGGSQTAGQASLTLFAAASLSRVMDTAISSFHLPGGARVLGDYEGTQALLTKLEADPAAADVFASADRRHMDQAVARGLVEQPHLFAGNLLVIAVPPGNPRHITGLADLARPGLRISLADSSVPAGSYAEQALRTAEARHDAPAGFAAAVMANVVTRQTDVETVVSDVAVGSVDAGIVYASDARQNGHIQAVPIAANEQPAIGYYVAVVKRARDRAAAQAFVDALLSERGQGMLRDAGFTAAATAQT